MLFIFYSKALGQLYYINRLVCPGLDVAQPGFEGYDVITRLDKSDAEFVDAIHTNGVSFFPNKGLGCVDPLGKLTNLHVRINNHIFIGHRVLNDAYLCSSK